jgi:hypothetical protein
LSVSKSWTRETLPGSRMPKANQSR